MSTAREDFLMSIAHHHLPASLGRALLRAATTLNRINLLRTNGPADDRVRCPAKGRTSRGFCLCKRYGSYDRMRTDVGFDRAHGHVPRYVVTEANLEARIAKLAAAHGCKVDTQDDPRGWPITVTTPSGAAISVPPRGAR